MSYFYVFLTIALTVFGQIAIKSQVMSSGPLPPDAIGKIFFLYKLLMNPWIISALIAAFLASLSWMAAMAKLELSHAYPFMSLSFVLVLLITGFFMHEPITWPKIAGMSLIIAGIIVGSQG